MPDWNDILSDSEEQPAGDELLNYLTKNLSDDEKHEFEMKTIDSAFINDALEGLGSLKNKQQLNQYVSQLNKNLQQQLATKKQRKHKRSIVKNPWVYITAVILLAICILGYFLIYLHILHQ